MQHVDAGDYMAGSAKQAVVTAMRDARAQVVGAASLAAPTAPPTTTSNGSGPTLTAHESCAEAH